MRADQVFRRCLADFDLMADAYGALAADYDWLFGDAVLADGGAINQPAAARLLQRISRTSTVLDAACGTGIDAAVLAGLREVDTDFDASCDRYAVVTVTT
jgi:SAM-dependent methyltransferase